MDKPSPKTLKRNLQSYTALHDRVRKLSGHKHKLQVESIAQTRSGSAISGVSTPKQADDQYLAIFKEGDKRKMKDERRGVASWETIYPGLAPRILSYEKRGQTAALLIEHLPGLTFERLLLEGSDTDLSQGLQRLGRTVRSVWKNTRQDRSINAGFMPQLQQRLDKVLAIHPEFCDPASTICGHRSRGFKAMVKQARLRERKVSAPFSVHIHGDFNLDNIIYDPAERRINFIDLHRSRQLDYVQDVTVFMVSCYRMQILDPALRNRLMFAAGEFYAMARRFGRKQGDATFEWRTALGLARSFATSTRFVLDKSQARNMYLRARYLLEQALDTPPAAVAAYRLPVKELFRV